MSLRTWGVRAMVGLLAAFALLFVKAEAAAAAPPDESIDLLQASAAEILEPAPPALVGSGALDPHLIDAGNGFASRGTTSQARIAAEAAGGFTVDGLEVQPLLPAGTDPTQPGLVDGAAVVFGDTGDGADTVIRPSAAGLETFTQIRDAAAPADYSWRLELAPGERLEVLSDGSVAVLTDRPDDPAPREPGLGEAPEEIATQLADPAAQMAATREDLTSAQRRSDGRLVAHVSAPVAWDANDEPVPASLSVDDDVVTMTVEHSGAAYPVQADPVWWGGANVYTGYDASYPLASVKAAIDRLDAAGQNFVVLIPQLFQWNSSNPSSTAQAPALGDSAIRYANGQEACNENVDPGFASAYFDRMVMAGQYARSRGMTVVIKPHVDVVSRAPSGAINYLASRTEIASANSGAWFTNYNCKLVRFAELAKEIHPSSHLIVGTELTYMSDDPYDNSRIRGNLEYLNANYPTLQLGYAVNWDATVPSQIADLDTYFLHRFGPSSTDHLDYIGVDAYYQGSGSGPYAAALAGGTVAEIQAAWGTTNPTPGMDGSNPCPAQELSGISSTNPRESDPNLTNPGIAIECLRRNYSQRVVLTELGYPANGTNALKAAFYFWNSWTNADADDGDPRCRWFKGIWPWNEYAGGGTDPFDLNAANLGTMTNFGTGGMTNCPDS